MDERVCRESAALRVVLDDIKLCPPDGRDLSMYTVGMWAKLRAGSACASFHAKTMHPSGFQKSISLRRVAGLIA